MPTLDIGGRKVTVGDDFLKLSPEQQNSTVEEIAGSLGGPAPAKEAPRGSSIFGPVAELGARGIDWAAQLFGAPPRQDQPLPAFGIGGWQPSAAGMAKDLAGTVQSGVTLPGDVYAGKVDPLSDEGIKRSFDLASVTPLSTLPTAGVRPATAALPSAEIRGAAETSYDAIRARTRGDLIDSNYSNAVADHMRAIVEDAGGARRKLAPDTHAIIDDVVKAKDIADLVDSRKQLGKLARKGGEEGQAASVARGAIDEALGPEITGITKTADRNYAISARAEEFERKIKNAQIKAANRGSGGNEGNLIRQAVEPLTLEGAKNVSPEVLAAAQRVTKPGAGVQALRAMSGFDPFHSKLMSAITLQGMNPLTLPTAALGAGARMGYDRILRNRARAISEALRAEAPATLVQPGYRPGGVISMPGAVGANTGILGPLVSEAPPLRLTVRPSDAY